MAAGTLSPALRLQARFFFGPAVKILFGCLTVKIPFGCLALIIQYIQPLEDPIRISLMILFGCPS